MKARHMTKYVKSRLLVHFGLRLGLAGVFLTFFTVFLFIWMVNKIQEIEWNRDFSQAGVLRLGQSMEMIDGIPHFDEQLLERIQSENSWLQLLNENGEVIYSLYTPPELPKKYHIGEITSYWRNPNSFPYPYDLYLWIKQIDGTRYTLLYGTEPDVKRVLRFLSVIDTSEVGQVQLSDEVLETVERANLQVQLLDPEGKEVWSLNKYNPSLPVQYTLSELALRSVYSERYYARMAFDYQEDTKMTWVVTAPLYTKEEVEPSFWETETGVMLMALLGLLTTSIVLFSGLSIWYANRFGTPVLHIINWLQHLGDGQYQEPTDRKGRSPFFTLKGKLRSGFRLFSNVISALQHLTRSLQHNEEMRRQLEQTREEWITGVSHDLKTPLSSIKGYAHMLEAKQYHWSEEEVREFSGIILEKANYMETLIDDLSLTYRLKNKALPLEFRETNVVELLEDVIKRFKRNPRFEKVDLIFDPPGEPLFYPLDSRWMSRAIENLLVNAFIHNPPGTKVEVRVTREELNERSCITIEIKDNGRGMDEETISKLFERYYRGSNTREEAGGSGLGMAIAQQIVLAHGGNIVVESKLGQGTIVLLRLFGVKCINC